MNCEQIHEMLVDLVYDELDPAGEGVVREHLNSCPACRDELAKMTRARSALQEFRQGEPAATAAPAMLITHTENQSEAEALRKPLKSRPIPFRRVASIVAAAAACVLIAVAIWVFTVKTPPQAFAGGPVEIQRQAISLTILSAPENVGPGFDQMQDVQAQQKLVQNEQPGSLIMQGTNSYTGETVLRDGRLIINGSGRLSSGFGWQGMALVRDQRLAVNLPKGNTRVTFTDVPTGIKPDSVRLRSLDRDDGLAVLEQNYQYDLADTWAILQKYIDKEITVVFKEDGKAAQPVTGKLLSFDEQSLVIKPAATKELFVDGLRTPQGPRTVARENVCAIEFEKLPEGLLSRPTLVWQIANQLQQVRQQFEVAYMTTGLAWRADYVLKIHPATAAPAGAATAASEAAVPNLPAIIDTADLVGYATVVNRSGVRYDNAQLKLMAGDVNLVREDQTKQVIDGLLQSVDKLKKADEAGFEEKSFFEYHLYTLGRPTSLANNETKQLSLVSGDGLKLRRAYVYDRNDNATAPRVVSEFKNTKENGLGQPLPKGVVRLYAPDPTGVDTYVAQTTIDHTPVKEKIRLPWGYAFDIACSSKQTNNRVKGEDRGQTWQYSIRNHKDIDVTVTAVIHVPASTYRVACSDKALAPHQRQVGWLEIEVPVKAGGEAKFDFTYDWNNTSGGGLELPSVKD